MVARTAPYPISLLTPARTPCVVPLPPSRWSRLLLLYQSPGTARTRIRIPVSSVRWIATAWEYDGNAVADPQRGLLVFTERNYSLFTF